MIPNFTSTSDMLGFLRALPKNADYTKMLKDDFNIEAPTDAPAWQKEYLWKYGVQGKKMGLEGLELIQYAAESAQKFIADHPYQLVSERFQEPKVDAPSNKPEKTPRVAKPKIVGKLRDHVLSLIDVATAICTIEWDGKKAKFAGYLAGICVSTASSPEKVKGLVTKNYGVSQFEVK